MVSKMTPSVDFCIDAQETAAGMAEIQNVLDGAQKTAGAVGVAIARECISMPNALGGATDVTGLGIAARLPRIPHLARGAVLPANKPFLAMVGDQRHGTNIEAPLATIQEAVALVMQDQTAAILSGVQASVGIQREILEAVLGIQIGDDVIGRATARYNRKIAIAKGGI